MTIDPVLFAVNRIYYIIITLSSCALCGAGGLYVYRKNSKSPGNQIFFLIMVSLVLWSLFELKAVVSVNKFEFEKWILLISVPFFLLLALLVRFAAVISGLAFFRHKWLYNLVYLPVIIILLAFSIPESGLSFLFPQVTVACSGALVSRGPGLICFKIFSIFYLLACVFILGRAMKKSIDYQEKVKIKVVFTGLFLPVFAAGAAGYAYRYSSIFNSEKVFYPIGVFPGIFILSALIISYAVLRYGFLSIKLILNKMVYYTLITFLLACAYIAVSEVFEDYLKIWFKSNDAAAGIVAALVVAGIFTPLSSKIGGFVQNIFLKDIQEFSKKADIAAGNILVSSSFDAALNIIVSLFFSLDSVKSLRLGIRLCNFKYLEKFDKKVCEECSKRVCVIPMVWKENQACKEIDNPKPSSDIHETLKAEHKINFCCDYEFVREKESPSSDQETVSMVIPLETGGSSAGSITIYHLSGIDMSWLKQSCITVLSVMASFIVFTGRPYIVSGPEKSAIKKGHKKL